MDATPLYFRADKDTESFDLVLEHLLPDGAWSACIIKYRPPVKPNTFDVMVWDFETHTTTVDQQFSCPAWVYEGWLDLPWNVLLDALGECELPEAFRELVHRVVGVAS